VYSIGTISQGAHTWGISSLYLSLISGEKRGIYGVDIKQREGVILRAMQYPETVWPIVENMFHRSEASKICLNQSYYRASTDSGNSLDFLAFVLNIQWRGRTFNFSISLLHFHIKVIRLYDMEIPTLCMEDASVHRVFSAQY